MEKDNIRSIYFFRQQEVSKPLKDRNDTLIKLLDADLNYKLRRNVTDTNYTKAMTKEIRIFIASQSILNAERNFIERLIRNRNDLLIKKNIYLIPIRWENEDKGMGTGRKQDEFNQKLSESEYMILLMWNSIGKYTQQEFELAYNNLKIGKKPSRIYALNKQVDRTPSKDEIPGVIAFHNLSETLWNEERIIIPFSNELVIQDELENMFIDIENKYSI